MNELYYFDFLIDFFYAAGLFNDDFNYFFYFSFDDLSLP